MHGWLVAADDRTGALETAAEIATADEPVVVSVYPRVSARGVVDLASRALDAVEAGRRAAAVELGGRSWTAHKIDSTLRGHWAAELRARVAVAPRPVLVVAAWPLMGRTCRAGVVHVDGRPVASVLDAVPGLTVLAGAHEMERWMPGVDAWAVVDVGSTDELHAVAAVAARRDWLVAGPAGAVGAVHAARSGGLSGATVTVPRVSGRVVLACASATAVSAEQLRRVALRLPDVEAMVASPVIDGPLDAAHAAAVGARVRDRLGRGDVGALLVVGGDTAAAVLGDGDRLVGGYVAPGMPWSTDPSGDGPVVVTKAGGFGKPDALVDVLVDLMAER